MNERKTIVIAIDGTAASGKGTLARTVAAKLDFACLDTGKLYRYVGYALLREGGDPDSAPAAAALARTLKTRLRSSDLADPALESDAAGQAGSKVAAHKEVRAALFDFQREFALNPPPLPDGRPAKGAILDGRDIGTVICPDAPLKLYITASQEIRATRRYKELQSKGISVTYDAVLADMRERDARDAGRETAPMKPADDAVILDTGSFTAAQVLDEALSLIKAKLGV